MKKILLISFIWLAILFLSPKSIFAGACIEAPGYTWDGCTSCECHGNDCQKYECYYYCVSCISGTFQTCMRADERLRLADCSDNSCTPRCSPPSCTPSCSSAPTCPTGTSETATSFGSTQTSCNNGCGTTYTRTCYCTSSCTPAACPTGYTTTNTGYYYNTLSCTNSCGSSNTRTCYKYACNDCTLSCPSVSPMPALTLTNTTYPVISTSCSRGGDCGGSNNTGTCYEYVSPQPSKTAFSVGSVATRTSTSKGFISTSTSGIFNSNPNLNGVNEPLTMTTTFSDTNGASDIEAMSFWFSTATSIPTTPYYINVGSTSPTAKAPSTSSWGFMLHKEGTSWIPYVPSMATSENSSDRWVKAIVSNGWYSIVGPSGFTMVQISLGSITASGQDVTVSITLKFLSGTGYQAVLDGSYNVFTMVNDVWGFTPRDNYSASGITNTNWNAGEIRNSRIGSTNYARRWVDTGSNWYVDTTLPTINSLTVGVAASPSNALQLNWTLSDNPTTNLNTVVVNAYYTGSLHEIGSTTPAPVTVVSVNGANYGTSYNLTQYDDSNTTPIGNVLSGYLFTPIAASTSGNTVVDIKNNVGGEILFCVTIFDRGGNYAQQCTQPFNLEDWYITKGGLVYSSGGYDFNVRSLTTNPWTSSLLNRADVGFNYSTADITSEMFGSSLSIPAPSLKRTDSKIYSLTNLAYQTGEVQFYDEYKNEFNSKRIQTPDVDSTYKEYGGSGSITSLASGDMCSGSDCSKIVYKVVSGGLTVPSGFVCNGKGVFFVDGNLVINPNVTEVNHNSDACLFFVKGNVSINPGANTPTGLPRYDEVDAFIITEGNVTIPYDSSNDGLLIKGGVYNPNSNISISRSLPLANRNTFPTVAIVDQPKYGVFSENLFGKQIDITKTEVGFKPY